MKIIDDFEVLRTIIEDVEDKVIDTRHLLYEAEKREMPFEFSDLAGYWKIGRLYVNQIVRTEDGYAP